MRRIAAFPHRDRQPTIIYTDAFQLGEGVLVGRSSIDRYPKARGLTRKKTAHAAEQERPDVAAARAAWCEQ